MIEKKINVLSLFTGGGGLDVGFHQAGFNISGCLEIDKPSCDTLRLNRGRYVENNCQIINADITTLDPSELKIGQIDFMIGGPPCQSFSAAGRRAGGVTGLNDTRGSLFWYYCKFLEHFKPKGFLFENVRGILNANKSEAWKIIKESFSGLGYTLNYRVLDAADYGIPQHRERVILVGTRSEEPFKFPRPTHGPDSPDRKPHLTARSAFADIDDPNEIVPPYGGKYGDLLPEIPPGMNYLYFTEKMGHPEPRFAWRSKFSGFLYKLDPDGLSKTVVAHQGRYDGPFHWKNRKLNLAEMKRIQGFPDDYLFVNSKVESTKQIGNSVAPKFAFNLAKAVMNQFFEKRFPDLNYIEIKDDLSFDKRKGSKAKITRKLTIKENISDQINLFDSIIIDWPNDTFDDSVKYTKNNNTNLYFRNFVLKEGKWYIRVEKENITNKNFSEVCFLLNFNNPINSAFNTIEARLKSETLEDILKLWDSIHLAVSKSSYYDSLQPLYGHFTEPYPKFKLEVFFDGYFENDLKKWLLALTDFKYLSKLQPLTELQKLGIREGAETDFVQKLRGMGYDVRAHETNRAIPVGFFKACYPFTIYSSEMTFVPWHEIGSHKTGDLKIIKTKSGYKPKKITRKPV